MAYQLAVGSGHRLEATPQVTSMPLTICCWFKVADVANLDRVMNLSNSTVNDQFAMDARVNVAGDPLAAASVDGGTTTRSETNGILANTWHHGAAVFSSTTSRRVYLDGIAGAANTSSNSPAGIDSLSFNVVKTLSTYYGGRAILTVAEAAVYSGSLVSGDAKQLAAGYSPMMVRPDLLTHYWPMGGKYGQTLLDLFGGATLTKTGTVTDTEHPPQMIYPAPYFVGHTAAPAAPAASGFPTQLLGCNF